MVAAQSTNDPKFEGSNTDTGGTRPFLLLFLCPKKTKLCTVVLLCPKKAKKGKAVTVVGCSCKIFAHVKTT